VIIDVAITQDALFSGETLRGDAYRTLLEFLRDHSKIALTPLDVERINRRIRGTPPTREMQMLNESIAHFQSVPLDEGLEACANLEEVELFPVDLAIIDDRLAKDLNFDNLDPGTDRRVAIAQVGWLRNCAKVRECLELANEKMLGSSGLTLRQYVDPLIPLSSSVDVFDSYLFDVNRSDQLMWKSDVKDFIVDMIQRMKRSAEINLFTVSDTREKAWSGSTLKEDLKKLLEELNPKGRTDVGKITLLVCEGSHREKRGHSISLRHLNHDRFVQFMMRATNKRRVISIGRGVDKQSLPTTIRCYRSEPLEIMNHLDNVRRTVMDGISRNVPGSAKVEKKFVVAEDHSIK
jgi:hypothetical protein